MNITEDIVQLANEIINVTNSPEDYISTAVEIQRMLTSACAEYQHIGYVKGLKDAATRIKELTVTESAGDALAFELSALNPETVIGE